MDWPYTVEPTHKEDSYKKLDIYIIKHIIKANSLYWNQIIPKENKTMKASEFIGMKVLDKEANEVGKVAEIAVVFKKCLVDKIFISVGSALSKKYLVIVDEDIGEVGDYLQLKLGKTGINDQVKVDKIEDFIGKGTRFKDFIGKTVLTKTGMDVGKITDMVIDPKGCLIHNIIVTTGGTLNKKHLMISDDDIISIGDYMILKLTKEDVEAKIID